VSILLRAFEPNEQLRRFGLFEKWKTTNVDGNQLSTHIRENMPVFAELQSACANDIRVVQFDVSMNVMFLQGVDK
jgi:hypothetical protein